MKKIPFVTVFLGFLMWLGLHLATDGAGNIDNRLWVSNPYEFGVSDVLSMFGHHNNNHWLRNMTTLIVFALTAEILLGAKRFFLAIVAIMVATCALAEAFGGLDVIGASGWLAATPGLMLWASMVKIKEAKEKVQLVLVPAFVSSYYVMYHMTWDLDNLNNSDSNVAHEIHLIGISIGFVFFFAAMFLAVKEGYRQLHKRKAFKASRRKNASLILERIAQGELKASDKKRQQLERWAA